MTPYDGFGAYFEDPATYQEMGMTAPEPEESEDVRDGDGLCTFCGELYCAPDCKPSYPSPYRSRFRERLENGDPDS